jgi:Flp pilus assembly protein TadD
LDAPSHFNLWTALERQGKHAECEAAYREAIRLKPDHAEAHARLGSVLLRQGRLAEAEGAYGEALRLSPSDPGFRNRLQAVRRRLRAPASGAEPGSP